MAIIKRLTEEGHEPFGRRSYWTRSYVAKILLGREAVGEYQPMIQRGRKRPDGEPIPGYYPAVVSEAEWQAAQKAKASRDNRTGRPTAKGRHTHLFSGLLRCADDGEIIRVQHRPPQGYLTTAAVFEGRNDSPVTTFRLDHFTKAILSQLQELSASELFADPGADQVAELNERLAVVQRRLEVATTRFEANPDVQLWADQMTQYARDKQVILRQIGEAKAAAANPVSASWAEAVQLMQQDDPVRLRQCLLNSVREVWCLFMQKGAERLAVVQVWFHGSESRRDYLIYSFTPRGRGAPERPARWFARSWAPPSGPDAGAIRWAPTPTDLRIRTHARRLRKLFMKADWSIHSGEQLPGPMPGSTSPPRSR